MDSLIEKLRGILKQSAGNREANMASRHRVKHLEVGIERVCLSGNASSSRVTAGGRFFDK